MERNDLVVLLSLLGFEPKTSYFSPLSLTASSHPCIRVFGSSACLVLLILLLRPHQKAEVIKVPNQLFPRKFKPKVAEKIGFIEVSIGCWSKYELERWDAS